MSLIDRLKKARAKAEKLSEKSKLAKSKGKEGKAARLEKRSEKKSGKANKLGGKLGAKVAVATLKGMTFGTGETMQDTGGEKTHNFKKAAKKAASSAAFQQALDNARNKSIPKIPKDNRRYVAPKDTKKNGPVDTSRKTSYKRKNK